MHILKSTELPQLRLVTKTTKGSIMLSHTHTLFINSKGTIRLIPNVQMKYIHSMYACNIKPANTKLQNSLCGMLANIVHRNDSKLLWKQPKYYAGYTCNVQPLHTLAKVQQEARLAIGVR